MSSQDVVPSLSRHSASQEVAEGVAEAEEQVWSADDDVHPSSILISKSLHAGSLKQATSAASSFIFPGVAQSFVQIHCASACVTISTRATAPTLICVIMVSSCSRLVSVCRCSCYYICISYMYYDTTAAVKKLNLALFAELNLRVNLLQWYAHKCKFTGVHGTWCTRPC